MLRNQFKKQTKNTAKHLHLNYRALGENCHHPLLNIPEISFLQHLTRNSSYLIGQKRQCVMAMIKTELCLQKYLMFLPIPLSFNNFKDLPFPLKTQTAELIKLPLVKT